MYSRVLIWPNLKDITSWHKNDTDRDSLPADVQITWLFLLAKTLRVGFFLKKNRYSLDSPRTTPLTLIRKVSHLSLDVYNDQTISTCQVERKVRQVLENNKLVIPWFKVKMLNGIPFKLTVISSRWSPIHSEFSMWEQNPAFQLPVQWCIGFSNLNSL